MSGDSGLNAMGVVSLSFVETGLERVVSGIQGVRDSTPDAVGELDALEKIVIDLAEQTAALSGAQKKLSEDIAGTNGEAAKGTATWKAYTDELRAANAEYLKFRQGQVTGVGGGTNISALSDAQKAQYLATADASGSNLVKALRDEQAAQDAAALATQGHSVSLSTLRHTLFDTSTTLALWGAGLLAIPILSAKIATDYERDFANVERATLAPKAQADALKASLISLSEQVPLTFKEITQIATAGAQGGIPTSGLLEYTRVVAELTATTNVSTTAAENMFQKFYVVGGVLPDQFEKLASAMLNVSIHTGATEAQISLLATRILGVSKEAGFTTPQIIGLAAAFSAISAQSATYELGTVTRFLGNVEKAAASGGPALETFAKTAGISLSAVQAAIGTDKFAPIFVSFIDGLDKVQKSGGSVRDVLADLGIKSIRDVSALENLANAHKTLHIAMDDAAKGWENQSILAQHFGVVQNTLASQTKELGSTWGAFMNQLGSAAIGPLTNVVHSLEDMLHGLTAFGSTGFGGAVLGVAVTLAVIAGSLALIGSLTAGIGAGVVVMKQAWDGVAGGISRAQGSLALYSVEQGTATEKQLALAASTKATTGGFGSLVDILGGPLVVGMTVGIVAIAALTAALEAARASSSQLQSSLTSGNSSSIVKTATQGDDQRNFLTNIIGDKNTTSQFKNLHESLANSTADWKDYWRGMNDLGNQNFIADTKKVGEELGKLASSNLPGAQAGFAALADKTNGSTTDLWRLLSVMPAYKQALTDQLIAAGQTVDKQNLLTLAYGSTTGGLKAASAAMAELKKQQQDVTTELNNNDGGAKAVGKLEDAYGKAASTFYDLKTVIGEVQSANNAAAQAQADAVNAGNKSDIAAGTAAAKAQKSSSDAAAKAVEDAGKAALATEKHSAAKTAETKALTDNYNAAVKASSATEKQAAADIKASNGSVSAKDFYNGTAVSLDELTKQYQTNGAELNTWNQNLATVTLKYGSSVADQFQAMGHNAVSESLLAQLTTAAPEQGKKFTDAMTAAMNEAGKAQADAILAAGHILNQDGSIVGGATAAAIGKAMIAGEPIDDVIKQYHLKWADQPAYSLAVDTQAAQAALTRFINANQGKTIAFQAALTVPGSLAAQRLLGTAGPVPGGATGGYFDGRGFGFAGGGYTGDGGKYQEMGVVHGGEFVFSKVATQRIGVENLAFQHNMAKQGYAEGGPVGGGGWAGNNGSHGPVPVALTEYDRSLLRAIGNMQVVIPGTTIMHASNQGNVVANTRRSN